MTCRGRCHIPPFSRKEFVEEEDSLALVADVSVILTYWKLKDSVADEGVWRGIPFRILTGLLGGAYRTAADRQPEFDRITREKLTLLSELEGENSAEMDRLADAFAVLLQHAGDHPEEREDQRRIRQQLLYHLGRWIYLVDGRDDFQQDLSRREYNPIAARYGTQGEDEALRVTLEHSLNLARGAFQLLDLGCRGPLVENILYLGLPTVQQAVFEGSWSEIKKQKIWRNRA